MPVRSPKKKMRAVLDSEWGRLFRNWGSVAPDAQGWPAVGTEAPELTRLGFSAFARSLGILGTCIREAPEFLTKRRRKMVTR